MKYNNETIGKKTRNCIELNSILEPHCTYSIASTHLIMLSTADAATNQELFDSYCLVNKICLVNEDIIPTDGIELKIHVIL